MKKNTMNYSAPEVELVEVAVESGFQTSFDAFTIEDAETDYWGTL